MWYSGKIEPQFGLSSGSDSSNYRESMAEGARFERADPLRGRQFSRLARSAAPSPLRALFIKQLGHVSHLLFFPCRDQCRGISHESFDRVSLARHRDMRIALEQ